VETREGARNGKLTGRIYIYRDPRGVAGLGRGRGFPGSPGKSFSGYSVAVRILSPANLAKSGGPTFPFHPFGWRFNNPLWYRAPFSLRRSEEESARRLLASQAELSLDRSPTFPRDLPREEMAIPLAVLTYASAESCLENCPCRVDDLLRRMSPSQSAAARINMYDRVISALVRRMSIHPPAFASNGMIRGGLTRTSKFRGVSRIE